MLEREILMGGEESGGIGFQRHLPERDGLLNALLLANVMAQEGKTLGQLVADLQAEYGEHHYGRIDLTIPDDIKNSAIARARALEPGNAVFAGMPILRQENLDGVKFYLDNPEAKTKPNAAETWLLLRASGTEPLLRIYTESCSPEAVAKLLASARAFALSPSRHSSCEELDENAGCPIHAQHGWESTNPIGLQTRTPTSEIPK
jgi:phosphomannomutase